MPGTQNFYTRQIKRTRLSITLESRFLSRRERSNYVRRRSTQKLFFILKKIKIKINLVPAHSPITVLYRLCREIWMYMGNEKKITLRKSIILMFLSQMYRSGVKRMKGAIFIWQDICMEIENTHACRFSWA